MSTTTTTAVSTIEQTTLAALPSLIGMAFAGKGAGLNVTIQSGIATADSDVAAAVDHLVAEFSTAESSNPLLAESIAAAQQVAAALGLQLPTEAEITEGVKKSACDLLNGFKAPAANT
nr:hypothetical protein [uncultured Lichenicoccus sp.]